MPVARTAELIEHTVPILIGRRVFGISLGYEDLIDHDQLRTMFELLHIIT
jgi:hypothetical protein